jgi:DNA primase
MSSPVAVYVYRSSQGEPPRRKLRFADKTFVWESFTANTWISGAPAGTATGTLYNIDKLAAAKPGPAFCVEGERDADNVCGLDLMAVTSGNAGTWKLRHSEQLVHYCTLAIVLPDHDDVGQAHAHDVARANLSVGIPTKIVKLPGLGNHEDVSDFLDRGGTRELLLGHAQSTPLVTLADLPTPKSEKTTSSAGRHRDRDPRLNALFIETLKLPPTVRGALKVCCPFHPDANPSLSLDLDRGMWFCHACRIGGGPAEFYVKWNAKHGLAVSRRFAWHRLKATYL